jgi:2,5-diamino-6-(ribosylamino)-4(3H)-pyrimidinone 5'-phosphate reductase
MERPSDRPFVYVNMAMTADGKITSAEREYAAFTSRHDKRTMDRLRAEADAVLVGAGTLRADDPPLTVRDPAMREHRARLGKPAELGTVVISARLDLPPQARFFRDGDPARRVVATVEEAPEARVRALAERAAVWRVGRGRVDVPELLRRLRASGVERLLVEGGGETNWSFLEADAVDELYVTLAPCLLGGRDAPTLLEGTGLRLAERRRLRLLSCEREGEELYLRWAVERA